MTVIADLHGGDPEDLVAKAEFQEIKDRVIYEVRYVSGHSADCAHATQRESGEGRTYAVMWKRYKKRVLLAMSSQAFAQLVSSVSFHFATDRLTPRFRMVSMVSSPRINAPSAYAFFSP